MVYTKIFEIDVDDRIEVLTEDGWLLATVVELFADKVKVERESWYEDSERYMIVPIEHVRL